MYFENAVGAKTSTPTVLYTFDLENEIDCFSVQHCRLVNIEQFWAPVNVPLCLSGHHLCSFIKKYGLQKSVKFHRYCQRRFRESQRPVFWGPIQGPLFLELGCACSPDTDLWWRDTWTPNMNKLCPVVEGHVHTCIQKHRRDCRKTYFSLHEVWKRADSSGSRDRFLHDHSSESRVLCKWEKQDVNVFVVFSHEAKNRDQYQALMNALMSLRIP